MSRVSRACGSPSLTADYVTSTLREGGNNGGGFGCGPRLGQAVGRGARKDGGSPRRVVLLTAGAVAAGAEDLTAEVEAAIAEFTSRRHPPKKKEEEKK